MKNRILLITLASVMAITAVGCSSTPKIKPVAWNIQITKKTSASIDVDLVGVASKNEDESWSRRSQEEYWKAESQFRKDADKLKNKLSKFLPENQPWIVSADNPQWKLWLDRGVYELYVVARLPEAAGDWKIPLNIGKKYWDAKTVEIVVVDSGISIQTKARN